MSTIMPGLCAWSHVVTRSTCNVHRRERLLRLLEATVRELGLTCGCRYA
jgi:hypothetical protein